VRTSRLWQGAGRRAYLSTGVCLLATVGPLPAGLPLAMDAGEASCTACTHCRGGATLAVVMSLILA